MTTPDELKAILDRIVINKQTKADIAALENALDFSDDQKVVLQWGKENINVRDIGKARDIILGGNIYQNTDAEQIKQVLRQIMDEYKKYSSSNTFVQSLFNYIEYEIGDIHQKIIQLLFFCLTINVIALLILKLINFKNQYTYGNLVSLILIIFAAIILVILSPLILRSIHSKKIFWKHLSVNDKKNISDYLTEIKTRISEQFELAFDPEEDHVALSGKIQNAYPHQAYEEKAANLRKHIRNLDTYLLSPINERIFIYGPPGSGKSTTLYKTFLNYKAKIKTQKIDYIPIFIHANQIANILDKNKKNPVKISTFIERIYQNENSLEVRNFIALLRRIQEIKLVIIVDALDEFVDKTKRSQLFDYLSTLITNTSSKGTKWILSCREEEYKAYSDRLNVANVRIQPMNLSQINELFQKRLKSFKLSHEQGVSIRHTLFGIAKAQRQNETFLKNPYYLTLWIYQLAYSRQTVDPNIPSINELHSLEIRREIAKGINGNPTEYELVPNNLVSNTIKVLSVLSFYLLKVSLKTEIHQGLNLNNLEILQSLTAVMLPIESNYQDEITQRRIQEYSNILINKQNLIPNILYEDEEFIALLNGFKTTIVTNLSRLSLRNYQEGISFLIVITSIIDQSYKTRLIDCNTKQALLFGFFNQRAADYLAACHLNNIGLTSILKANEINFWLFRAIAIAIAISERPQDILKFENLPRDSVFETAIGNGLTLIPSKKKKEIKPFINLFINHLMNEERLSGENYDPCDPLRILMEVKRLCLNGYSEHINLSNRVFYILLKHKDAGISEMATETLITYACQVSFRSDIWQSLLKHLLQKSLRFEFGLNSLIKFCQAIKER